MALAALGPWGELRRDADGVMMNQDKDRADLIDERPDALEARIKGEGVEALLAVIMERCRQSRWAEARALHEAVVDACLRALGPDHPDTLTSQALLVRTWIGCGDGEAARTLELEVLKARTRALGPDHPDTLDSVDARAMTLHIQRQYAEASALYEDALARRRRTLGDDHPDTLHNMSALINTLLDANDLAAANALFDELRRRGDALEGALPPAQHDRLQAALAWLHLRWTEGR